MMLTRIVCILLCVFSTVESLQPFNRNEFRTMLGYFKDIYLEPKDTANRKWFETHLHSYGFVAYDAGRNHIVISFAGSYSILNWIHNVQLDLVPFDGCSGCSVHKGFLATYKSSKNFVLEKFHTFRRAHPTAKVYVAGYSLGAAQAAYCIVDLYKQGVHNANLMTFGAPRAGNRRFADYVNSILRGMNFRITFKDDKVPILPGRFLGYKHIGTEVNFRKNIFGHVTYKLRNKYEDTVDLFRLYNLLDHISLNYRKLS